MTLSEHRIRRLLSMVRLITGQMIAHGADPEDGVRHLAGRVAAIGRAAIAPMAGGADLELLVLDELLAQGVHRVPVVITGPEVRLGPKSAVLMRLAIHELITNAIKFGALSESPLSESPSLLRVIWWITGPGNSRLHFEWAEDGVRAAAEVLRNPGFGSHVVKRMIARELHGSGDMLFLAEGLLCIIEIPTGEALLQNE
jgi:two-component system, chemotaxis family, CheB/CheR fusion protein